MYKILKKVARKLNNLRNDFVKNNAKLNIGLLNFLYQYLIVNFIEFAEVEIFFSFFSSLIEVSYYYDSQAKRKFI